MTVLSTRPTAGPTRPGEPSAARPLVLTAAVAGAGAAVVGLTVCMSVALTGWFLADAGAHGDTTDALRIGVTGWLAGHGAHPLVSGSPVGITPLAITMMLVLAAFRAGRWAQRSTQRSTQRSAPSPADGAAGQVPARTGVEQDERLLAGSVATFTCAYLLVAVLVGVLASRSPGSPGLGRTILGALLVGMLAGGCGLVAGSGRLDAWLSRVPRWTVDVVAGAVAGALALLAAGALLVGVALLLSFNEAATVFSELHLGVGDALSYTVLMGLFAPNVALLGASYLVGPGFAFGVGTTVSPTAVTLGVVPAFPVLAALPDEGAPPGWLVVLLAVPVLAGGVGVGRVLVRQRPMAHDLAALRGAGAGFLAGVLVTALVGLAGGPLGTGRMAQIGAPLAEVLVFATGLMGVGGLVGAVAQNWWRRRHGEHEDGAVSPGDDAEATVEVLR